MEPEISERFERVETDLRLLRDVASSLVEVARSQEGRLQRLTEAQGLLTEAEGRLTEAQGRLTEAQARTDELFKQTQGELSVLIRMMDEWIRNNPRNGKGQPPAG